MIVDAVDLNKSIDNPHRVMSNFKNENEDDVIQGKQLTLYIFYQLKLLANILRC